MTTPVRAASPAALVRTEQQTALDGEAPAAVPDIAPAVIIRTDLQAEYESWGSPPLDKPEDVLALLQRQLKHGQVEGPLFEFLVQTHASMTGMTTTAIRGLLGAWPPIVSGPQGGAVQKGFLLE